MQTTERILNAGPIRVLYEYGFLRYISSGDAELLRMIYFALRDENWGTYDLHIEDENIDLRTHNFRISYNAFNTSQDRKIFQWKVLIIGENDGTITFSIEGTALEDIKKNRAGFCILHPVEMAGQSCCISDVSGQNFTTAFPKFVSATNPFKNIKGIAWKLSNGTISLSFEGDVFETEDQRNWTDASFKTFCTPLDAPFPVLMRKGDVVQQRIALKCDSKIIAPHNEDAVIRIETADETFNLPAIGVCAAQESVQLSNETLSALAALSFSHYRIDVDVSSADSVKRFWEETSNAIAIKSPVELVLKVDKDLYLQTKDLLAELSQKRLPIKHILLLGVNTLSTPQKVIDAFSEICKLNFPAVSVGAGTDYNFTELNRYRFDPSSIDFVSFSVQPQEHAFDDRSILENTQAQFDVVQACKNIYPGKAVHISPLTLKKRYNPYAATADAKKLTLARQADPRQYLPIGAIFLLSSLKYMTLAGTASVTLFETIGALGILSADGKRSSIYSVLAELSDDDYVVRSTTSNAPLKVDALSLIGKSKIKLFIYNKTALEQTVVFNSETMRLRGYEYTTKALAVN